MDSPTTLFVVILCAGLLIYISRKPKHFPPGPKGLPLLGNILDIPRDSPWLAYQRWSREYDSDIIHYSAFGTHVLVLNSAQTTFDLLERKSAIYSDRPQTTILHDLMNCQRIFSLFPYNNVWRQHRRLFHRYFHPTAAVRYRPWLAQNSRKLLRSLLNIHPSEDFMTHLRVMTGSTILRIVYGIDVENEHTPYLAIAEHALSVISTVGETGSYLVDFIPILKYIPSWFPGAHFKKLVLKWRDAMDAMVETPFTFVRKSLQDDIINTSIAASLLNDLGNETESENYLFREQLIKDVTVTAYAGGAETTLSALGSFILAMLLYPNVQLKAHEELDRVVGSSRLPGFADQSSLPYITAMVIEILRWRPVLPSTLPRRLMANDVYKGYHLPKGSIVIGNAWAIMHDEHTYKNPDEFIPERFLTEDGKLIRGAKASTLASFGFGRRSCAGKYFAESAMWINVASLLASFDVVKAVDADGNTMEPSGEYISGLTVLPRPFKCVFQPRSAEIVAILRTVDKE